MLAIFALEMGSLLSSTEFSCSDGDTQLNITMKLLPIAFNHAGKLNKPYKAT